LSVNFDNLKLRTKILIPLVAMALVFGGVIAISTARLNDLTVRYTAVTMGIDPATLRMARVSRTINEIDRDVYEKLNYDVNDPQAKAAGADFDAAKARGDQTFDEAANLDPGSSDRYRAFKDRFDSLYEEAKAPAAIGASIPGLAQGSKLKPAELDKMAVAARELETLDTAVTAFTADVHAFNDAKETANGKEVEALKSEAATTIAMMICLGFLSIVGGLAFSWWIVTGKVAAPLAMLAERMKRLSRGDLAVAIDGQDRKDEVGQMAGAVQTFKDAAIEKVRLEADAAEQRHIAEAERAKAEAERAETARRLSEVVSQLASGLERLSTGVLTFRLDRAFAPEYEKLRADFNAAMQQLQDSMKIVAANTSEIRSGAGEITQASDDLSKRTEQQAASLEETAAALDEITATVTKTAQGAREARDVVATAKTDAEHSGTVVRDAVAAMSQIEASAQQISQIIGVIDEIAFQTNLLALNAGVEAARAGDAGRGFAVVASEVRALAQRSAEAAKEIKSLISASTQQVGRGVSLVGETGEVLQRIVTQVTQINAVVAEIAASAQEQATGLAQVNTAVNQMDQMTQQNAAMVEQSTAASHALARDTQELSRLISRFEIGADAGAPVERMPARRPARRPAASAPALKTTHQRKPDPAPDFEWSEF
jgi:methyl-accepting chemotaxis protein